MDQAVVLRKIEMISQFHAKTVVKANDELGSLSGRLLAHMHGIRRINMAQLDSIKELAG